jgi:hypothetical protein
MLKDVKRKAKDVSVAFWSLTKENEDLQLDADEWKERYLELENENEQLTDENARLKELVETSSPIPAYKTYLGQVVGRFDSTEPPPEDSGNVTFDLCNDDSRWGWVTSSDEESFVSCEEYSSTEDTDANIECSAIDEGSDIESIRLPIEEDAKTDICMEANFPILGSELVPGLERERACIIVRHTSEPTDNKATQYLLPVCNSAAVEIHIGGDDTSYIVPNQVKDLFQRKLKMRNEHIQRLKDEVKKSIAYSSGLEHSVEYVGYWFQQISERFRPRLYEIDTLLRPLKTTTYNSEHWCDIFAKVLGTPYACKRDVTEMFKEWLGGKCSYPAQWKTLLDRFQESNCPELERISNHLRVRLHETIPQERLLRLEAAELDKLCVACNSPLPCIREFLPPFDIDIVESQEETPLPNPTEAQV